jgi:glucan phosphorylase
MNLIYVIHRYFWIKSLQDKSKVVKRITMMGGKTAPGNVRAK